METTPEVNPLDKLNARQQKFVVEFLDCFVAAEAYRRAGYSEKNANVNAARLIANDNISAAISYLGEKTGMPVGEAVQRMTWWGRGSLQPFLTESGAISLLTDEAQQHIHLVKKYKRRKEVRTADDGSWTSETETVEIELYDAKDAVDKILQLHGRYKQLPGDANQPKRLQGYTMPDGTTIIF